MPITDPREIEFRIHEREALARRECPYSGLPLTAHGEAGPSRLSCDVCDCFGYSFREVYQ